MATHRVIEVLNEIYKIYRDLVFIIANGILLLMMIFGGEWHLSINFNSLKGLIEAIKNYRK